jgi:integrase
MPKKLVSTNISRPGLHWAATNLFLCVRVGKAGVVTRSWVLRFERNGHARDMGLGRASDYTLAEARERARLVRQQLNDGLDPIEVRRTERARKQAEQAASVTFEEASRGYIQGQLQRWVPAHADDWITSLASWAHPVIGRMAVGQVGIEDVLRVLRQPVPGAEGDFWSARAKTAQRVRSRIELVLGWAGANGLRAPDTPNPARWKRHLEFLLPAQSKLTAPRAMPALPYSEAPAFLAALRECEGIAALALQFVLFTAVRTADVARCKISDIDLGESIWRIAGYSKTGRPLNIPLSAPAVEIARQAAAIANGTLLFPSVDGGAMLKVVYRIPGNYAGRMSVHGSRAIFKTWATEATAYERELIEVSLGHTQGNAVEQRYLRGDAVEKRRRLMNDWSSFLSGKTAATAEVVAIGSKRKGR